MTVVKRVAGVHSIYPICHPPTPSPKIPGRGVNALPGLHDRRRLETRSPGKRSATGEIGR